MTGKIHKCLNCEHRGKAWRELEGRVFPCYCMAKVPRVILPGDIDGPSWCTLDKFPQATALLASWEFDNITT